MISGIFSAAKNALTTLQEQAMTNRLFRLNIVKCYYRSVGFSIGFFNYSVFNIDIKFLKFGLYFDLFPFLSEIDNN